MNAEIGSQLHLSVHQISCKNDDLLAEVKNSQLQNDDLKAQNDELLLRIRVLHEKMQMMEDTAIEDARRTDQENTENLQRNLEDVSTKHRDPWICGEALMTTFPDAFGNSYSQLKGSPGWSKRYIQMTTHLLKQNTAYVAWRQCTESSLLVLGGATAPAGRAHQNTFAWLSPATVHAYEDLTADGCKVAFHSCHPDVKETPNTTRLIISNFLYQLVAWKPEILRHRVQEFESIVKSKAWNSDNHKDARDAQLSLLGKVIKYLSAAQPELYLVLDRMDLCRGPRHLFLRALQHLIATSPGSLKVMVVTERIPDDYENKECRDLVSSSSECRTFGRLDWDQRRQGA